MLCRGHTLLMILMMKKLLKYVKKKNCKRLTKQSLEFKRKDNRKYVKWKGYKNSFNSWINKKFIA